MIGNVKADVDMESEDLVVQHLREKALLRKNELNVAKQD